MMNIRNEIELGQAVRLARKAKGLTQAELAKTAQVSRSFVITLEQGTKPGAELARVMRVLRALGIALKFENDTTLPFSVALEQILETEES